MKKFIYVFISIFCIIFFCGFTEGQKVYDKAGLLTKEQIQTLETEAIRIAKEKSVDVIILTTDNAESKTSMEYADDFYDENGFGYEENNGTGILLLIDMDNRNAWISTSGKAIAYFTDARIELILDSVFEYLPDGNYYNSCTTFLNDVEYYMGLSPETNNEYYNYTPTPEINNEYYNYTPTPMEIFSQNFIIYLIISLVGGVMGVFILVGNSSGKVTVNNITYLNKSSVKMNKAYEQYIRTTVTQRKIEKNNSGGGSSTHGGGSSTHTSSSGNTHGGGGRSF